LDPNRPLESFSHLARYPLHEFDGASIQWRLDIREVVAVFENEGINSSLCVCLKVCKRLSNDLLIVATIQRRAGQRLDRDHGGKKFLWQRTHTFCESRINEAKSKAGTFADSW
jgi:hypothetical protein